MKRRTNSSITSKLSSIFVVAVLVMFFGFDANAADSLRVGKYVIGGGGGSSSTTVYRFNGTIGQTGIGKSNTVDLQIFSGFWMGLPQNCCIGIRGDLNYDGTENSILDLTFLVNQIFRGGPDPFCSKEGDLDGDGQPLQILDLTYMINKIFRGGPDPLLCN